MKNFSRTLALTFVVALGGMQVLQDDALSQVENVPVTNQVYEFLDRMGVKGILPLYGNTMIPISRQDVADLLLNIDKERPRLTGAEREFLEKFKREFAHDIDGSIEDDAVLFRDGFTKEMFSDKEKYLYTYADSNVTVFAEFLGAIDSRLIRGDTYGSTNTTLEQHGGRIRGTLKDKFGFFLQGTDGTVFGDKAFALSDPLLRQSNKLKEAASTNFDFAEAYLRADLNWFNLEFGKERTLIGTGYSGRLLLSENAPAFDFVKIDAKYKSVKFVFIHASLVNDDSIFFPLILTNEPEGSNKYLALHRLQFSLFGKVNVGVSEMTIYQRFSPDFAYLNPINFYKSAEHSLGDRDNSFMNIDFELFPATNYKLYGTLLIDDVDFGRIGTGWWGNELGWQGGVFVAEPISLSNVDVAVEYTRIEPYVYSNRTRGIGYSNNNIGLGHHLGPNSDEWFLQLSFRPNSWVRAWVTYSGSRHGDNLTVSNLVVRNVGGNLLQGHTLFDDQVAIFLDGNLMRKDVLQCRAAFEPVNNVFVYGIYELRFTKSYASSTKNMDHYGSIRVQVEY